MNDEELERGLNDKMVVGERVETQEQHRGTDLEGQPFFLSSKRSKSFIYTDILDSYFILVPHISLGSRNHQIFKAQYRS